MFCMAEKIKFKPKNFTIILPKILQIINSLVPDADYEIEIKKVRNKRSLNANNYYWQLIEKLSKAMNKSKDEMHEIMLQRYGTFLTFETGELFGLSTEVENDPLKTGIHTRFRGTSELNGKTFYHYYVIKGSRYYNSKEMSQLINGLVEECKEQDIETLTPEQLALLEYER